MMSAHAAADTPAGQRTAPASAWSNYPLLAAFGFCVLAFYVALHAINARLYHSVIDLWSFIPFRYPFIDAEYMSAQIECWRKGVDVYVTNPCDVLGRLQDLSPLWLRLPFWPADKTATGVLGLSLAAAFIGSLVFVPLPRKRTDATLLLLTLISPGVVFAVERGNQDLIVFVLAIGGIVLLERSFVMRLLGYSFILLAGLLKFYPLIMLVLVLRESRRTSVLLLAAAAAVVLGFAWGYHAELTAAIANIPMPTSFIPGFGAARVPDGITALLAMAGVSPSVGHQHLIVLAAMSLGAFAMAIKLANTSDFGVAFDRISLREMLCLVGGAALIVGCFFAGVSSLYRGIHFLLVLPGLLSLARHCPSLRMSRMLRWTAWLAVALLFSLPADRLVNRFFGTIDLPSVPWMTLAYWICCELAWWWVVVILLAPLVRFTLTARATSFAWQSLLIRE